MSDWKNVQYKDGKYRTLDEGGGGASALTDLTDVNVLSPSDGQVLKYDSTTQKWKNENESGGTVTDVQVDGTSVVNQQGVAEITIPTPPTPDYPVTDVKVNGTSVVSNKQALITSYKEVTQSEYNALPSTKETDGVAYFIKDSAGADAFPPLIYSKQEREVGVWIDGKPLYEKTFEFSALNNNADATADISDLNADTVAYLRGMAYGIFECPILFGDPYDIPASIITTFTIKSSGLLCVRTRRSDASSFSAVVTMRYTKTTDTAGSGIWNQQGAIAHHYSTTEKVIGTWVDGKPLYEKTFYYASLPSSGECVFQTDITVDNVVYMSGICLWYEYAFNIPHVSWDNGLTVDLAYNTQVNDIRIHPNNNSFYTQSSDFYITVRYTKTTD